MPTSDEIDALSSGGIMTKVSHDSEQQANTILAHCSRLVVSEFRHGGITLNDGRMMCSLKDTH